MKRLLHIIASPREEESRTLQIAHAFLEVFRKKHPDYMIDELDVTKEHLPSLNKTHIKGKAALSNNTDFSGDLKDAWPEIARHIERFKTANFYLISTPMWNFNIPYMLKHYIDVIIWPKYLFRYKEDGTVEGLIKNKKMVVITSRGGAYSGAMHPFDLQEPYLRALFGFIGITDIQFINAEPMDMGHELQTQKLEQAKHAAEQLALKTRFL